MVFTLIDDKSDFKMCEFKWNQELRVSGFIEKF